jgi:lysozyme
MVMPPDTSILMIDISHNQAHVDLGAAQAAGVAAVFLKATEGATWQDPTFKARVAAARALGFKVGAYHFGTAADPAAQVDNFITTVTKGAGGLADLVLALDLEHNDNAPNNTITPAQGESWVGLFAAKAGRSPMLYAGSYLRDLGGATGRPNLASCPLWLAQYAASPVTLPGWASWTIWQFTDGRLGPYQGEVDGVGPCDQDAYNPDAALAFEEFWETYSGAAVS